MVFNYQAPPNKLKFIPNVIDLAVDLLSRLANASQKQPISILNRESPPTRQLPVKKLKFAHIYVM